MNNAEGSSTVRPNPQQHVLTCRQVFQLAPELLRRGHRFAVNFEDHITAAQPGIFCRAARLYLRHRDALYIGAQLQLLTHIRA